MGKRLIGLLLLGCLLLSGCKDIRNEYKLEQIQLNNSNTISGSFFLGCGNINGGTETLYYFYTNNNGAIKLHKTHYDRVTIYYTKEQPKAVYIELGSEPRDCGNWIIYIPENSIVNNYDVNIK